MTDPRADLERERRRFVQPDQAFERLLRRRAQKRLHQRITAGIVGIVIFVAVALGAWLAVERNTAKVPGDESISFRNGGEFIVFTPRATGAGWDLGARDPETDSVRTIVETTGIVDGFDKCPNDGPCSNFIR